MFDGLLHAIQLIFGKIFWVVETIKCALWNLVYGIGSLLLMFLDFVQDCFKKLAGLDTYYYEGTDAAFEREDILQRLLTTPEILKAFGSLVVVGIILLFLFTIIQFIRVEYTTEGAKNSKGNIIQQSLKSLAMFVIVPVACMIGIFLSNKILQILDRATAPNPGATVAGNIFKIAVYDANPVRAGTSTYAFTANAAADAMQMAKYLSGYEAYEGPEFEFFGYEKVIPAEAADWFDMGVSLAAVVKLQVQATKDTYINPAGIETQKYEIFDSPIELNFKDKESNKVLFGLQTDATDLEPSILKGKGGEELADAIDDMISHRRQTQAKSSVGTVVIAGQGTVPLSLTTCIYKGEYMDYTNFRVVGYFYNVQDINYVILFVCSGFAIVCLYKAAFGMVMRLYMCSVLFIISPPIIAMAPMDNGKALSSWKSKFIGQVLAGYGTVVALNVFFTILPIIEKIELFSSTHKNELTGRADVPWILLPASFFNGLVQVVFILVGCFMLKDISKTISGLIGAEDAMASGEGMSKQIGAVATKAAAVGVGAAGAIGGLAMKAGAGIAGKVANKKTNEAERGVADAQSEYEAALKSGNKDDIEAAKSKLDTSRSVLDKRKKQEERAAKASLTGERLRAGGASNLKNFVANSAVGKMTKEVMGDYTPTVIGGKGLQAHDAEIAGSNSHYERLITEQKKAESKKEEEKSLKSMGGAAEAAQHVADRATMGAAAVELGKNIKEQKEKTVAEVTDMKNKIVSLMGDMVDRRLEKKDGEKQIYQIYNQLKTSGALTGEAQAELDSFMQNLHKSSAERKDLTKVQAQLQNSTSFETKIEVAMKDGTIEAKLKQIVDLSEQGRTTEAMTLGDEVDKELKANNLKLENLGDAFERLERETKKENADKKDLKKLLGQIGKITK